MNNSPVGAGTRATAISISKGRKVFHLQRAAVDELFQKDAFQILHRDESLAILLVDLVNGANVGMVEGGCRLGLAAKAHQSLRILGHLVRKEFQSNEAVQFRVLGLIDDAHPATADLLDDAVMRDDLINHGLKS